MRYKYRADVLVSPGAGVATSRRPQGADAFKVLLHPSPAAATPHATYCHACVRILLGEQTMHLNGAGVLQPQTIVGDIDYLEHPWLYGQWVELPSDDTRVGRSLYVYDGADPGIPTPINRAIVLWRIPME